MFTVHSSGAAEAARAVWTGLDVSVPSGRNGSMATTVTPPAPLGARSTYAAELGEVLRVIVVAGVPLGFVLGGGLSRLGMYLLRLTSPDSVTGVVTDDGFEIGGFTLFGVYNLAMVCAFVGIAGVAAYIAVSPWLIGPPWFRAFTVAFTAGVLVAAIVIHPRGRDFAVLGPTWLAVVVFVAIPFAFGCVLPGVVDRVARPGHWTSRGAARWALPVALLAVVPLVAPAAGLVALVVAALLPLRRSLLARIVRSRTAMTAVRAGFLAIPLLGLLGLWSDLAALY